MALGRDIVLFPKEKMVLGRGCIPFPNGKMVSGIGIVLFPKGKMDWRLFGKLCRINYFLSKCKKG